MARFEFVCLEHTGNIRSVDALRRRHIQDEQRLCPDCGVVMEQYFGNTEPQVNLSGHNWPKRDIKESAYRKRRSRELGEKQKKVWDGKMPKLNLDPDVQRSFKEKVAPKEAPLSVKKV